MEVDYDIFELVTVTDNFWLFDAECYQRRYATNHGQPLAPGHYVVNWPESIRVRRFNEHAAFHGPFNCRKEAQAACNWMQRERALVLKMAPKTTMVSAPITSLLDMKQAASLKPRASEEPKAMHTAGRYRRQSRDNETSPDQMMAKAV